MFEFNEWKSRATLSIFCFMPTLDLLPLLKLPFFRQNRQDAKSRHIFEKKLQSNHGQIIVHETDSSASGFFHHVWVAVIWLQLLPLRVACWTCPPKESGVFTPPHPLQEICYLGGGRFSVRWGGKGPHLSKPSFFLLFFVFVGLSWEGVIFFVLFLFQMKKKQLLFCISNTDTSFHCFSFRSMGHESWFVVGLLFFL